MSGVTRSVRITRSRSRPGSCFHGGRARRDEPSTSRIVDDIAGEAGGRVIRAPVGEVNVAVRMREEQRRRRWRGERWRHSS
jgi:hypothetical protein